MDDIYKEIISRLILSDEDREDLKVKRGFTDSVIDKLQIKSCGPEVLSDPFYDDYPEIKSGLSHKNIVIPYFNINNEIYHLRPHKFGIKGAGAEPYMHFDLFPDDCDTVVIAESEFKSVAACMLGFASIGLPGISSMSKKNLYKVLDMIDALKPKKIIICFDNEIKDDPKLSNYKQDFRVRYDTQIYSFIMATLIYQRTKIITGVATIPNEWMTDGKADIDGCLSKGMTSKQFQEILNSAVDPLTYKKSWKIPPQHLSFIERKIDKFFYTGPVHEVDNCYYIDREDGREKISNFVVKMIHTIKDSSKISQRYCRLISNYGTSQPVMLSPEHMSSKTAFTKFCYENGDFEFFGSDPDMKKIWHYVFMHQDGLSVDQLDYFGYHEDNDAWFFKNGAYCRGRFYPQQEGICWIDDQGFRIQSDAEDEKLLPIILNEDPGITIANVLENLESIMGVNHARILLGWTIGCYFMPEITEEFKVYPFFFLYGKQGSGKSVTANWIGSFFGVSLGDKGIPFEGSSVAGMVRVASKLSMIPVWLEEYRNGRPDTTTKNNYLRSVYDKSTVVKATRDPTKIVSYTARSTMLLSGEEFPTDAALNSRFVMLPVYGENKKDPENIKSYNWMQENKFLFSYFGHMILMNKKKFWEGIKNRILFYMDGIDEAYKEEEAITSRSKLHYSIIAGVVEEIIGYNSTFEKYIQKVVRDTDNKRLEEQALSIFWEDVFNLLKLRKIPAKSFFKKRTLGKKNTNVSAVFIDFGLIYSIWEKEVSKTRTSIPASRKAIEEHIKSEHYFISNGRVTYQGKKFQGMLVEHAKLPSILTMIVDEALEQDRTLGDDLRASGLAGDDLITQESENENEI